MRLLSQLLEIQEYIHFSKKQSLHRNLHLLITYYECISALHISSILLCPYNSEVYNHLEFVEETSQNRRGEIQLPTLKAGGPGFRYMSDSKTCFVWESTDSWEVSRWDAGVHYPSNCRQLLLACVLIFLGRRLMAFIKHSRFFIYPF